MAGIFEDDVLRLLNISGLKWYIIVTKDQSIKMYFALKRSNDYII